MGSWSKERGARGARKARKSTELRRWRRAAAATAPVQVSATTRLGSLQVASKHSTSTRARNRQGFLFGSLSGLARGLETRASRLEIGRR